MVCFAVDHAKLGLAPPMIFVEVLEHCRSGSGFLKVGSTVAGNLAGWDHANQM